MANPENLKKGKATQFKTGEEQAKRAREAGKASGRARRAKRSMREWAEMMGNLPITKGKQKDPKTAEDIKGSNPTMAGAIIAKLYEKALKGDPRAIELLVKIKGEAVEKVEIDADVHIDPFSTMTKEELLRLYAGDEGEDEADKE